MSISGDPTRGVPRAVRLRALVALLAGLLLAALAAGCGGSGEPDPRPEPRDRAPVATAATTEAAPGTRTATTPATLLPAGECAAGDGFACSSLQVPLSRTGHPGGTTRIAVAVQRTGSFPRGTLVALAGGPGQPGLALGPALQERLGSALDGYRLVVLDTRGTGAGALSCPALQRAVGSSDLAVAPTGVVEECGRRLGRLASALGTQATVADLDDVRRALGADRLSFLGISYGTYVAERYAMTYPRRVGRLLLDSVVPAQGVDVLQRSVLMSTRRVLDAVCARTGDCRGDPEADLQRTLARDDVDPAAVLDAIVARSIGTPRLDEVPAALHAAAGGSTTLLDGLVASAQRGRAATADELSAALHAATLCADSRTPWGSPGALPADREQALAIVRERLAGVDLGGWDARAATANGLVDTCRRWPPLDPLPPSPGRAGPSPAPTLELAGQLDLSTPLADARAQAARGADVTLVEVPGAGHSLLLSQDEPCAVRAARRFLRGDAPRRCSS